MLQILNNLHKFGNKGNLDFLDKKPLSQQLVKLKYPRTS